MLSEKVSIIKGFSTDEANMPVHLEFIPFTCVQIVYFSVVFCYVIPYVLPQRKPVLFSEQGIWCSKNQVVVQ